MNSLLAQTGPPIRYDAPPMNLVTLCTTISAPSRAGDSTSGAKVLTTTSGIPASLAIWLSNKELARRVGLAPSTTLVRTRQLERAGELPGYRAEIDPAALDMGLQALIAVCLKQHTAADVASFRDYVLGLLELNASFS